MEEKRYGASLGVYYKGKTKVEEPKEEKNEKKMTLKEIFETTKTKPRGTKNDNRP
jgi:hypothetical protein